MNAAITTPSERLHLLVAEDDPVSQALLATFLKKWGHTVDVVGNGREAVEAVRSKPYDLLFMDVEMPGMNGIEATRAIRALPSARRRIPIVAVTAHASLASHQEYLAAGMNDYIAKPIDRTALAAAIARATAHAGSADAEARSAQVPAPAKGPLDEIVLSNLEGVVGRELLAQLVMRHVPSIEARFAVLARIAPAGNAAEIARHAHDIKSVCGSFGAADVQKIAAEVERACDQGKIDAAIRLIEPLTVSGGEALAALTVRYGRAQAAETAAASESGGNAESRSLMAGDGR